MSARRLYAPRPVVVRATAGQPRHVGKLRVVSILEQWVVEDRWWTEAPIRRHYFELVLAGGGCAIVFRDMTDGSWHAQR